MCSLSQFISIENNTVVIVTLGVDKAFVLLLLGRDLEHISRVLTEVTDWEGLAYLLNIRTNAIDAIKTKCALDGAQAACYRRALVVK